MKNLFTALILIISPLFVTAQTVKLDNLSSFDKLIIKGDVKELTFSPMAFGNQTSLSIEGIEQKNVTSEVSAGTLTLKVEGSVDQVKVFGSAVKRIVGPKDMVITGAETVGDAGNYVVTNYTYGGFADGIAALNNMNIQIPEINIPEMNFEEFEVAIPPISIPEMNIDLGEELHMSPEEMQEWMQEVQEAAMDAQKEAMEWQKEFQQEMQENAMERQEEAREAQEEAKKAQKEWKEEQEKMKSTQNKLKKGKEE
ncbi:hypothetical protein [Fulvivirga ligni]|uniref:hypothetical protein n=1 Tax=Fulvivirga ligni TaxID=2904246 RepID=UPI001F23691C|nr:hypothetical protein [Fulvivirga ligni]UII23837.1 hypothetical protein LVD16_11455 [Fulvivirga ligni]